MSGTSVSPAGVFVMLGLVLASALGVIFSSHQCRLYYATLQTLENERWALEEDYSRLMIEHSTMANPHRVLSMADAELHMAAPAVAGRKVVHQ